MVLGGSTPRAALQLLTFSVTLAAARQIGTLSSQTAAAAAALAGRPHVKKHHVKHLHRLKIRKTIDRHKLWETGLQNPRTTPHIILVVADDLGWHDVGYNGGGIPTPNIDRLASEGVRLDNYYVQPTCSPTRATIMTGRFPSNHGVLYPFEADSPTGLPLSEVVLPEVLSSLGYDTHMVGKWHLGFYKETYTPTFRGFDSFYGFYGCGENYMEHRFNGGYDFRRDEGRNCGKQCSVVEWAKGKYSTDLFTNRSLDIIKAHDANRPLFLYLAWQAVHSPSSCFCPRGFPLPHDSKRNTCFACMLTTADWGLGKIVDGLEAKDMLADTVIVFSSDNGGAISTNGHSADDVGSSNWPLRGGKHTFFEGGTHALAFLWAGKRFLDGRRLPPSYEGLMGGGDWLPTFMSIAGVKDIPESANGIDGRVGKPIQGLNMWPTLSEGAPAPRETLFIGAATFSPTNSAFAVRSPKWKFIMNAPCVESQSFGWSGPDGSNITETLEWPGWNQQTRLLYDLSADPREQHNLAEAEPEVVEDMIRLLGPFLNTEYTSRRFTLKEDGCLAGQPIDGVWGPWST